jgi:hypothetical protein
MRDNQTNIELASSSRKIAEESRRDNLLNIEIAKSTSQVAEETRQDSAAMKTIAVLTLTFLPGTAISVSIALVLLRGHDPNNLAVLLQHEQYVQLQSGCGRGHSLAIPVDLFRCYCTDHCWHIHNMGVVVPGNAKAVQSET